MKRTSLIALACGVAFSAFSFLAMAKDGVLLVGTEGDAPQFSMADAKGNVTGYDADVANAICGELKLKCEFVVQSFSTLVPSMDTNRFDVIISGLGITEERKQKIDYSIAYGSSPQYFAAPKGSPIAGMTALPDVLKALTGKAVGVVNGTTHAKFIAKNVPSVDLKTYDATTQMTADLAAGRLDAAFSDGPTWEDFLKSPDGKDFVRVNLKIRSIDDTSTLGQGMGVGLRKGNAELKTKLDTAVCDLIKSGKMTEISQKWFQEDYTLPCGS